jgi:hypothetical protein
VIALHEESEDDEIDSRASSGRTILGKMFAGSEEKNAAAFCVSYGDWLILGECLITGRLY